MKKKISTIFAFLMIVVLVAGCAAPATPQAAEATQPPAATDVPAKSDVTLTYLVSQGWAPDAEMALAKQFTEKTGITVDYQVIPSDQYFNVLKTKLNSGEGPDLFGGQSGKTDLVVNYDVEKNAVDLSGEPWTKTEDPQVLDQSTVNGKVYGQTVWNTLGTTWVMNYNKDIFSKLSLSVPTTFAELKSACEKIKASGITTPIYEPMADGWHQVLWFAELGVQIENVAPGTADLLNNNKTTFAENPTALLILQQYKDLYDSGCYGDNALSDAVADQTKAISSGAAAMTVANLTFAQQVKHDYPEFNEDSIGVFIIPLADNQVLNVNPAGPTKFIWKGSKHIPEAVQFLNFLAEPESLQYRIDNDPNSPTLPFPGIKSKLLPSQQAFLDASVKRGVVYQTAVTYVNPQWMDMGKDIVAMFTGTETPQEFLANIDKRRAEGAKAAKDPNWQ
ncbi:MAG TPA: ABC transporter substrate-binding protein [Anaerolinea sp.]|nr:ABC transporter substrate-binding protein [Anaerolinea sp.]